MMTDTPASRTPPSYEAEGVRPESPQARPRRNGPPLWAPALSFAVLTIASAVVGSHVPRPDATNAEAVATVTNHDTAMTLTAVGLALSVIPLAVLGAALVSRWRALGVSGTPGPLMGLAGAVLAGASLTVTAGATWAGVQAVHVGSTATSSTLASIAFAGGSAGFAAPLGLMVAGTAVPALITRSLPRALSIAGIVIAACGVLSAIAWAIPALTPMFPIGRFGGALFLVAAAFLLPTRRAPHRTRTVTA